MTNVYAIQSIVTQFVPGSRKVVVRLVGTLSMLMNYKVTQNN